MKKAFTLVELLVVIGIIAILAGILIASMSGSSESARAVKCLAHMKSLANGFHAVALESGYYPMAGAANFYVSTVMGNGGTNIEQGWIGCQDENSTSDYISPYASDEEARRRSLENGSVWKAVSGNLSAYVCPLHKDTAMKKLGHSLPTGPAWSYVVNAHFGCPPSNNKNKKYLSKGSIAQKFTTFKRSDRILLLAELPFLKNRVQDPQFNTGADEENDPILQYDGSTGDGKEIIGFNHQQGKRDIYAHVCFADGHTEKFKLPRNATKDNLVELTRWLCMPTDNGKANGKQIDVTFDGERYQMIKGED